MCINIVVLTNLCSARSDWQGCSDSGYVFEDGHVFGDAGIGALHLHRGEVFGLEIDDALLITGLLGLVQEVTDGVEMLSLQGGRCLHLSK